MFRALWNRLLGRDDDPAVSRGDEAEWREPKERLQDRVSDLEAQSYLGGGAGPDRPHDND